MAWSRVSRAIELGANDMTEALEAYRRDEDRIFIGGSSGKA